MAEDIPLFDPLDITHYLQAELKYMKDRQYFKGIDEHREISEREMNEEIPRREKEFRKWYHETFPSKVMPKTK